MQYDINDLLRVIGAKEVEVQLLRAQLRAGQGQVQGLQAEIKDLELDRKERDEQIAELQKQISQDYGEPT